MKVKPVPIVHTMVETKIKIAKITNIIFRIFIKETVI